MAGAANQGEFPILQELLQQLAQGQLQRLTMHQGQQDRPEVALQGSAALQFS